jgi:outer membrane protein assembly factor BamC
MPNRSPSFARVYVLGLSALLLAGCSALTGDPTPNYVTGASQARALDVPPDLTQLASANRAVAPGGVISASQSQRATGIPAGTAPQAGGPPVAVQQLGEVRVERLGQQRWLVTAQTPEQLWPQIKAFWADNGFTLTTENTVAGVMETDWNENRAKISGEVARNALARALGNLFDSGERDQYRTRLEPVAGGTEIHIAHRGLVEVYNNNERLNTLWRARPSDPGLEAEFLARLMVKLSGQGAVAAAAPGAGGAAAEAVAAARDTVVRAPERPAQARVLAGQAAPTLELDDSFERAWRRVGLALDRGGFSVEDRDRAGGLYYVRYIDPNLAGKEEPSFFSRLFGTAPDGPVGPVRYRLKLAAGTGDAAQKTLISVLTSDGGNDSGEDGQRIVERLVEELR